MTPAIPLHPDGFSVCYADPPWQYGNKSTRAAASHNYATMTAGDLARFPLPGIMAKDAALFMWATPPMIQAALNLGAAWGFHYKTVAFWWGKCNAKSNTAFFGMGNWTRANGEPCLLFTRGKIKRASAAVPQFVWARRGRHSEKPAVVRERIVQLMGDVPRIELFARHQVDGWARWGNEA